jgi:hypothetical protein
LGRAGWGRVKAELLDLACHARLTQRWEGLVHWLPTQDLWVDDFV